MVDRITKLLKTLSSKEQVIVNELIKKIAKREIDNLDIKRIRELDGLFRVRKDKLRIIFYDIYDDGPPIILEAGKRKDV